MAEQSPGGVVGSGPADVVVKESSTASDVVVVASSTADCCGRRNPNSRRRVDAGEA